MREYGDDWRRDGGERQEPRGGQHSWAPAPSHDPWAENYGYPPQRSQSPGDPWNPQGSMPAARPARPIQRRQPPLDPGPPERREPRTPGRLAPGPRPRSRRAALLSPLILIAVPLLGAVASGPSLGIVFTVAALAGALGAALLSTSNGLWWIVPCTPTALLAVAFAWAGADGLSNAKTTVAAATNVFQGVAGAFPGVAAGTVAALVVAGVRVARSAAETRGRRV